MDTDEPWFRTAPGGTGGMRLFFFPFAGGNPAAFLPWQPLLGSLELQVASLPAHGTRLFEPPEHDMDTLIATLTRAIAGMPDLAERRFAFFGHSLGALLAFEVARALRRGGLPMPERLWASGAEGPQTRVVTRRVFDLPDAEFVEALRDFGATPSELFDLPEMIALLLPSLRADFGLNERYAYRPEPPLDLPIHVLCSDRDEHVSPDRAAGWARETSQPLRWHDYAGDHFFLDAHQDAIAALLVKTLTGAEATP